MKRGLLVFAGVMLLAAGPANAKYVLYRCTLDLDIMADYPAGGETVTVRVQGQTFQLPRVVSASGAQYSDGKTTLWEHQGVATFETPGASLTDCKLNEESK